MDLLNRLKGALSSRHATKAASQSVSCDEHGATVWVGKEVQNRLHWRQIDSAFAYKQDCLTVDRILVVLCDADGDVLVQVSEEDAGYESLLRELPRNIAGFPEPEEWFASVAFPAFQTNWTELYRKRPAA